MPAPISPSTEAFSWTTTSIPFWARPSAAARPPIPPPATMNGLSCPGITSASVCMGQAGRYRLALAVPREFIDQREAHADPHRLQQDAHEAERPDARQPAQHG